MATKKTNDALTTPGQKQIGHMMEEIFLLRLGGAKRKFKRRRKENKRISERCEQIRGGEKEEDEEEQKEEEQEKGKNKKKRLAFNLHFRKKKKSKKRKEQEEKKKKNRQKK